MTESALLREAKRRFERCVDAEKDIRREALEDLRFRAGDQWPADIRGQREQQGRPCLTINRLPQFLRQVTNEIRQNRPSIRVSPVDSGADPETAKVIQGVIRHIEVASDADIAYDWAAEGAATGGFGFFRVVTEYEGPDSFDQVIRIRRIRDPFSVYFDPASVEPNYADARFCFVVAQVDRDEFRRQNPGKELAEWSGSREGGADHWATENCVLVAEYFYLDEVAVDRAELADGSVVDAEGVDEALVVRRRKVMEPRVRWAKLNGEEVLEEGEWPGRYLPVVPVLGDETIIDGKRMLYGLIRHARDPQRMYNYWASAETEVVALAPRAPFIGAAGQFEGYERQWRQANVENMPYLEYKPTTVAGTPVGPPQRQVFEPPIQAINHARLQCADDLKATTGIYDASLGARSNEQSGRAILARQKEGDVANFHYADNLARAIKHLGRILVNLIPKVYDAPRVLRIIGEEEDERLVAIHQPFEEKGVTRIYDLGVGTYDVTVDVGPSYSSKRQEAVDAMLHLASAYPPAMQAAGDLLVKNMDWPGAQQIAERLRKLLPPNLAEDEAGNGDQAEKLRMQLQQVAQQNEQLIAELEAASETLRTKRMEIDSRERIEAMRGQIELVKIEAQLASRENVALLGHELARARAMTTELAEPGFPGAPEQVGVSA